MSNAGLALLTGFFSHSFATCAESCLNSASMHVVAVLYIIVSSVQMYNFLARVHICSCSSVCDVKTSSFLLTLMNFSFPV